MSLEYKTLEFTGELPDGRKIHQIISDPKGITLAERITRGEAMHTAFNDNIWIQGEYKRSVFRLNNC